jgi:hypothetical protein
MPNDFNKTAEGEQDAVVCLYGICWCKSGLALDTDCKNLHVFPHVSGEGIARAPADVLHGFQENSTEEVQCQCLCRCHSLGFTLV